MISTNLFPFKENHDSLAAPINLLIIMLIFIILASTTTRDKVSGVFGKKQNFSLGYLTYLRQWNYLLDKEIEYIERNNLIELMIKKPSRDVELPIIEMK